MADAALPTPRRRPRVRRGDVARGAVGVFAAAAAAHLVGRLAGADLLVHTTKPLLMPALAAYAAARGAPRALVAGLGFGWAGDVLLQVGGDGPFLAGMGAFAAGHVCYLTLFRREGRLPRVRERRLVVGYGAAWGAGVAALWPGLDPALRGPVAAYSLLLAAMALCAARSGARVGAGGALFLLSDTLIATDLAGRPQPPAAGFWVMATYLAAQYLIADGLLRRRLPATTDEKPVAIDDTPAANGDAPAVAADASVAADAPPAHGEGRAAAP
ncbi:lysoplasmalogenase [Streptomyces sp. WMMC500]|uniref:lysoplasmalogenase n=1 Tax=Streptomyces sp. WMMC500 TaxID=3015154 RepID=UPI00248AE3F5|nr:lysoplasmalogenase [Streptomyces sp. WMMC500]WBB60129.1 lysoplasmalogenase [Streptomyces sp. WMMC500]